MGGLSSVIVILLFPAYGFIQLHNARRYVLNLAALY